MFPHWLRFYRGVTRERRRALALAALGVVFGDIGTSPLYALHVCFVAGGLAPTRDNVLGVLSLVCWALLLVVTIKYVVFVMRADLNGEGGILALTALASDSGRGGARRRRLIVGGGLFGAALLYGDGMLTPAISVLSAVEGLKIITPDLLPGIHPAAVTVLVALFWLQRRGSGTVGHIFGPVMLLWFAVLAVLGLRWIAGAPEVLAALSPVYGARLLLDGGWAGYLILGSVFLAVTGGEALYADIGHFGTQPIRRAWLGIVLPAVLLSYFGQGAMLLQDPSTVHHTFFRQAPTWALIPLVALATAAAVIASQAVISGAFSLTAQALQLGYCPRVEVRHSSEAEEGQVYVPLVNWLLCAAALALVFGFGSSAALAGAYGIAVSATMVLTTLLATVVFAGRWGLAAGALLVVFLPIDLAFLGANLAKLAGGGWVPLLVAGLGFLLFSTWRRGQELTTAELERMAEHQFLAYLQSRKPLRTPGTAVFLSRSQGVPRVLLHGISLTHALSRHVVVLSIRVEPLPRVQGERLEITRFAPDLCGVVARYGWMERPDVPALLRDAAARGVAIDVDDLRFILARLHVIPTGRPGMAVWRKRLFAFLSRNGQPAHAGYRLPPERVLEIGVQVEI